MMMPSLSQPFFSPKAFSVLPRPLPLSWAMGRQTRSANHFNWDNRIIVDYSVSLLRTLMVQVWPFSVIAHDRTFRWRRFAKDFRCRCLDSMSLPQMAMSCAWCLVEIAKIFMDISVIQYTRTELYHRIRQIDRLKLTWAVNLNIGWGRI